MKKILILIIFFIGSQSDAMFLRGGGCFKNIIKKKASAETVEHFKALTDVRGHLKALTETSDASNLDVEEILLKNASTALIEIFKDSRKSTYISDSIIILAEIAMLNAKKLNSNKIDQRQYANFRYLVRMGAAKLRQLQEDYQNEYFEIVEKVKASETCIDIAKKELDLYFNITVATPENS